MKRNTAYLLIYITALAFTALIIMSCSTTHKGKCAKYHRYNNNNPNKVLNY